MRLSPIFNAIGGGSSIHNGGNQSALHRHEFSVKTFILRGMVESSCNEGIKVQRTRRSRKGKRRRRIQIKHRKAHASIIQRQGKPSGVFIKADNQCKVFLTVNSSCSLGCCKGTPKGDNFRHLSITLPRRPREQASTRRGTATT